MPYVSNPMPKKANSVVSTYTIAAEAAIVYIIFVNTLIIQYVYTFLWKYNYKKVSVLCKCST